jgi:hypothetical protein
MWSLLPTLLIALVAASGPRYFDVMASFVAPARPGGTGSIAVTFAALNPDVQIDEEPAPRLKLDLGQSVLVDKQLAAPKTTAAYDPVTARYLDLKKPVQFPVELATGAPRGPQTVKASVVYFFCSQREGWCRRGSAELDVPVTVP